MSSERTSIRRRTIRSTSSWPSSPDKSSYSDLFSGSRLPWWIVVVGHGCILKLDRFVTKDEARSLNWMPHLPSGTDDRSSYNPSQWVRLPGSVNEKTGRIAKSQRSTPTERSIQMICGSSSKLTSLPGFKRRHQQSPSRDTSFRGQNTISQRSGSDAARCCRRSCGLRQWELLQGRDQEGVREDPIRGGAEDLRRPGWPEVADEEIHAFAYKHELPRYMREFRRQSNWAESSITNARAFVSENPLIVNEESGNDVVPTPQMMRTSRQTAPPSRIWTTGVYEELLGGRPTGQEATSTSPVAGLAGCQWRSARCARQAVRGSCWRSKRNLQTIVSRLEKNGWVERFEDAEGVDRLVRTEGGRPTRREEAPPIQTGLGSVPGDPGAHQGAG